MTPPPAWSTPPSNTGDMEAFEPARRLLSLCEGRRPSTWTDAERPAIDALIDEVVALRAPWPAGALTGTWKLAYLQPGPNGAGVDRRIPFPEFDFNDSYQQFDLDAGRVTNVFATPHVLKSGCQNAHKSQQLDSTRHPTI